MVDYELFKRILSQDDGYIEDRYFLDYKTVQLLGNAPIVKTKQLFKKGVLVNKKSRTFVAETKCQMCGTFFSDAYSMTTLDKLLSDINHLGDLICLCKACHEKHHFE